MTTLVVFDTGRWVRIADGEIADRGDVVAAALPSGEDETVVAIMPAREVTIRTLNLPALADLQANAAARIAMADESLVPIEALHVAAGPADEAGDRAVVAVEATRVTERLLDLAQHGLDPDRLLAAPLLLPIPEAGFVRATFDDETVVRGPGAAFLDDAMVTPIIAGEAPIVTLERDGAEAALIRSVEGAGADLRHGIFAKRRRLAIDLDRLRRLAATTLVLGLLVLAAQIVLIVRLNWTASNIEADNRIQAAAILPPGTVVTDPVLQAEARLAAMQGAGGGFTPLASAIASAINSSSNVELGSLVFDGTGGLRATVRGTSEADLSAVELRLAAAGLRATPGPLVANQGRPYRDITVYAR